MPFEAHKLGIGPSKNIHFSKKCFIVWAKTPENQNMMISIDIVPYKIFLMYYGLKKEKLTTILGSTNT